MNLIPHCDDLYARFFLPWYSESEREYREFESTRPDVYTKPDLIARPASELSRFSLADQNKIVHQISITMRDAAIDDFSTSLKQRIESDWDGINQIDQYYGESQISALIDESDETNDDNVFLVTCIELGSILAEYLISEEPAFQWLAEMPYWESALWHPPSGNIIAPVHWAIKKMSSYGWDDGLVPKCQMAINLVNRSE